jgi:hypothetical protein
MSPQWHPLGVASGRLALQLSFALQRSFSFFDWTRELRDFADAFCFGRVRARIKRSADLRSVPARVNAKAGRFDGSDVPVYEVVLYRSFECFIEVLRDAADAPSGDIRKDRNP